MNEKEKRKIAFLGFGAFNCAMAHYLTKKFSKDDNYNFFFWDIDEKIIQEFIDNRTHPHHFQEMKFNEKIQICQTKEELIKDADLVIIRISAQAFNIALKNIGSSLSKDTDFVIISKGIDIQTHELLSSIARKNIDNSGFNHHIAIFSGGTVASDIANQVPLIAEIACENDDCAKTIANIFSSDSLRIHTNNEVLSVEISGALKNFISIGSGICEGLGFTAGTKASFITQAAFDVYKIAKKMGASDVTFLPGSTSFWGDIMLSSFGETRNKEFGKRLCIDGKTPSEVVEDMKKEHKTVEGYYTVKASHEIAKEYKIDTPTIDYIYKVLYKGEDPQTALRKIMIGDKKN